MAKPGRLTLLVLATALAFSSAIRGPELFDDPAVIDDNPSITVLWPLSVPLHPPAFTPVAGRPVTNLSLAIDYRINRILGIDQRAGSASRTRTVSYHITNILIHIVSGLLLFGIIRRTLVSGRFGERWAQDAGITGFLVAAVWLLHPLQTEAVDYLSQRSELLVSCFALATLYISIRAWNATRPLARFAWCTGGVATCLLGMGSKEVMFGVPLLVLLYDRAFHVRSWRELLAPALRWRRWYFAALFATLALLLALIARAPRSSSVGFHLGVTWAQYLTTQGWAIAHYLRLLILPTQLSLDYGFHPVPFSRALPGIVLVGILLIGTVLAWTRANKWGWLGFTGAWFFCLLAPSSSVVPVATEIAAERRVYLALAGVVVVVVVAGRAAFDRWLAPRMAQAQTRRVAPAVAIAVLALLALATFRRSALYASPERVWRDATAKRPTNPRAWNNLGEVIADLPVPRKVEADSLFRTAVTIDPLYSDAWYNLAATELQLGRSDSAERFLRRDLTLNPGDGQAMAALGSLLLQRGDAAGAEPYLKLATDSAATPQLLVNLGVAYMSSGQSEDAARTFRRAITIDSSRIDAMRYLGLLLTEEGDAADALPVLERAAARSGSTPVDVALLALGYADVRRTTDAVRAATWAVKQGPGDPRSWFFAGRAMYGLDSLSRADAYLTQAVKLEPGSPDAMTALGRVKLKEGKRSEATDLFRRALKLNPADAAAQAELGKAAGRG